MDLVYNLPSDIITEIVKYYTATACVSLKCKFNTGYKPHPSDRNQRSDGFCSIIRLLNDQTKYWPLHEFKSVSSGP